MRTLAQKQNQPQKPAASSLAPSNAALHELHHHADPISHLQRTIGNQTLQQTLKTNVEEPEVGSTNKASPRFGHDFGLIPLNPPLTGTIQRKLAVNKAGDEYEQEADKAAEQVMRMPEPQSLITHIRGGKHLKRSGPSQLQGQTLSQAEAAQSHNSTEAAVPPFVNEVLSQEGHPLDTSMRSFMEPRFGVDFGQVRIHANQLAAQSAQAVSARAYTVGNHIVFGAGQYMPDSKASHSLLAHELAHVVQQGRPGCAESGEMPAIQRQIHGSGGASPPAGVAAVHLSREYIQLACDVIAEIQRGIEEGRTWTFEDEFLLQGDEELGDPARPLAQERREALQQLVRDLDEIIQDLESGALVPPQPANRDGLRALWRARHPPGEYPDGLPHGHPGRWSPPIGTRRRPNGVLDPVVRTRASYINNPPSSPPGMLRPAAFPTWWVLGCHTLDQPAQPPTRSERVTPEELGLSREVVVYLIAGGGWDWEPRGVAERAVADTRAIPSSGRRVYDWHYDESAGRVYIVVDGQQMNLLRSGRVEIQR